MSESKFKLGDNVSFHGTTQVNQGENFKAIQNNQTQNQIAAQKVDSMLAKADNAQEQELKTLAQEISDYFDARLNQLDEPQKKKVEELESSSWKGKIKLFVPFLKDFGIDISAERDITPDEFAGGVRKALYGNEPILLNLLKDPTES